MYIYGFLDKIPSPSIQCKTDTSYELLLYNHLKLFCRPFQLFMVQYLNIIFTCCLWTLCYSSWNSSSSWLKVYIYFYYVNNTIYVYKVFLFSLQGLVWTWINHLPRPDLLRQKLLPNLNKLSVVVIGNAFYITFRT